MSIYVLIHDYVPDTNQAFGEDPDSVAFEFVKVITQNIVKPDTLKTAFSMTSQLCQHYVVIC